MKKGFTILLGILLVLTVAIVVVFPPTYYINWFKPKIDTHLSITYPEKQQATPLTENEKQQINAKLRQHVDKYKTANLYIGQYQKQQLTGDKAVSNYQLIITARDGCVIESKPIHVERRHLVQSISNKVDDLIAGWWRLSAQTSGKPKKLTKISNM